MSLSPDISRIACCDRGYGRPSLRAVGSTSRKPGVLGYRTLRRTVQVHLGSNPLRLPGGPPASPKRAGSRWRAGTPFSTVSRHQFAKYPGYLSHSSNPRPRVSLASGHSLWYIESEGWSAVHGFPSPQKPLLRKEKTGLLPTSRGFLV